MYHNLVLLAQGFIFVALIVIIESRLLRLVSSFLYRSSMSASYIEHKDVKIERHKISTCDPTIIRETLIARDLEKARLYARCCAAHDLKRTLHRDLFVHPFLK